MYEGAPVLPALPLHLLWSCTFVALLSAICKRPLLLIVVILYLGNNSERFIPRQSHFLVPTVVHVLNVHASDT